MNGFEPGEGWREVEDNPPGETERVMYSSGDGEYRYWVREVPVLPLPTEPYTVIRVTWREGVTPGAFAHGVLMLDDDGRWADTKPELVLNAITGFEVLAEPCSAHYGHGDLEVARRDAVKAVLARVAEKFVAWDLNPVHLIPIAREFGVES